MMRILLSTNAQTFKLAEASSFLNMMQLFCHQSALGAFLFLRLFQTIQMLNYDSYFTFRIVLLVVHTPIPTPVDKIFRIKMISFERAKKIISPLAFLQNFATYQMRLTS